MIKKVIFDLDDTLIINKDNYIDNYNIIINKYNLNSSIEEFYNVIGDYELSTNKYNKYELLELINKHYNTNFNIELVNDIIKVVGKWTDKASEEVVSTLKYLSQKYELYVLTNWFYDSQSERLKTAGIYNYFKDIKSADIITKPNEAAFKQFFDNCSAEECVMIGDNYKIDIEVPNTLGMKTILCNFKNKDNNYEGNVITKFDELVDLL